MGASYGIHAAHVGGVAGTALMISGKIDEARAGDAAKLMLEAVARLRADAAGQRESFVRARRKVLAAAMARTGGASSVAGELEWLAGRNLPLDHAGKLARRIATLTPAQVGEVAAVDLALARMVVQIGGKPAVVEAAFTALAVTPTRPE
jgi:predicted Zn-dependent peptidase